jgi:hypothetical protein
METALERSEVVVLSGPRQCGKTTLARELLRADSVNYFDLEDPASLARLDEPMTALRPLEGLVVIDEVQRRPDLFPILRVLADRRPSPAHFLILGSASGDLLRQTSESLAGRSERITIGGFSLGEVEASGLQDLWRRGGFPLSYLAATETDSLSWRSQFIQALLERDLPQWGVRVPASALRRFWTILAHYHGQTWNATRRPPPGSRVQAHRRPEGDTVHQDRAGRSGARSRRRGVPRRTALPPGRQGRSCPGG